MLGTPRAAELEGPLPAGTRNETKDLVGHSPSPNAE
jgi:hypothetical protein